jgi:hypothetical protein
MKDQADLEDDRDPASHVATSRQTYQRIAPVYDLLDLAFERYRYRALRPRLFEGLSGVLLDAGIGQYFLLPGGQPGRRHRSQSRHAR